MTKSAAAPQTLNRRAMIPIFAIAAVDAIGMGIVLPLLPYYTVSFGATPFMLGLMVALFSASQFIAGPILGRLSDRYGRKPVLAVSQLGTMLSFTLLAMAGHLWMVFAARILDGLTSGNISVVSAAAIDQSTPATRKQAIGVVSGAIGTGMIIGPALPALMHGLGPQAAMWLAAGLSGVSMVLTILLLPDDPKRAADKGGPKPKASGLLSNRQTLAVLAVLACLYLAMAMYLAQLALFAAARIQVSGLPFGPREMGYAFAMVGFINIFVQLFALRRINLLFTEIQLVVASLGLMVAGFAALAAVSSGAGFALALLLSATGSALARPTLMAAVSLTVDPRQQGAIMGINQSAMAGMNMIGPLVAGAMISAGLYAGWALAISGLVFAGLLLAAGLFATGRWPVAQNARPASL